MCKLYQLIYNSPSAMMLMRGKIVKETDQLVFIATTEKIYVFVKSEKDRDKSFKIMQHKLLLHKVVPLHG